MQITFTPSELCLVLTIAQDALKNEFSRPMTPFCRLQLVRYFRRTPAFVPPADIWENILKNKTIPSHLLSYVTSYLKIVE